MKKILSIFFLSVCSLVSLANHTKGGWIYYEYLGAGSAPNTSRYKIVLFQYMICNPNSGQLDQQISLTFFAGNNQFIENVSAPLMEHPNVQNCPQCDPCIINKPTICYKYATYEIIKDLVDRPEGYTIAYQRCCRIAGIVNIQSPSSTVGDTWTIKIPGTSAGATATANSSPKFIAIDTAVICAGNSFRFNFNAIDPDGDRLVYEFAPAYSGGNSGSPTPGTANPNFVSVPYNGQFSASQPLGSQVTIDPSTGLVTGIAPGIGEYVLTVVVKEYRNGVYIAEARKSLHLQVASCNLVAAKLLDDNSCDGFTKTFKNNLPDPPGASYQWDFGVPGITTDVSTLANPTYTYPDTGTYKVTLSISLNGICTDSASAFVKVYPKIEPSFSIIGQCKNTAIQFTDKTQTTYGVINSWLWDFSDPAEAGGSNLQHPTFTYPSAGNYPVTLTVTNSKGCVSTIVQTAVITDKPDLQVTNDTLICSIDTLQLNAAGTGTVLWSPNYNINNQSNTSPLVSPDVPTKYYVTLTDPFGCKATDSVFVDVKLFVTIDAGRDTGICAGDAIRLNPISDALHYNWSPAAALDDPMSKNPMAAPAVTTRFYVIGNIGKCQSMDSVTVRVAPYPGGVGIPDTVICFGNSVQLNASDGSMFTWSPAFFLNDPNIRDPVASPDRSIRYVVTIRDTLGCPKPVFDTVLVQVQRVNADAGPRDTSIVLNQSLQLNGTGGQFYLWTPPTGLNDPTIANPVSNINDNIDYILTVRTPEGCAATDTISVKVFKLVPGIFVPNVFTPNGDNKNDIFRPIAIGMKQINVFKVFNRWGVMVYSSEKELYEAAIGWDGSYKGRPQDPAIFVWIVEGVDYLDKKIVQKGTVTLVR